MNFNGRNWKRKISTEPQFTNAKIWVAGTKQKKVIDGSMFACPRIEYS